MHKILLIISLLLFLIGCGENDVKKFVKQVDSSNGMVEPLPKLVAFKPYIYSASNIRSPFGDDVLLNVAVEPKTDVLPVSANIVIETDVVKLQPDPDGRRKSFYLEQFSLKSLQYVGSMLVQDYGWALILDPNDKIHHVQVGDYLGQHNGKIKQILDDKIIIRELLVNQNGAWEAKEKEFYLTMKNKKDINATDKETSA